MSRRPWVRQLACPSPSIPVLASGVVGRNASWYASPTLLALRLRGGEGRSHGWIAAFAVPTRNFMKFQPTDPGFHEIVHP